MQLGPCQSVLPAPNPSTDGAGWSIDGSANNESIDSAVCSVDGADWSIAHNIYMYHQKSLSVWLVKLLLLKPWSHWANGRVTDKKSFYRFISVLCSFLIRWIRFLSGDVRWCPFRPVLSLNMFKTFHRIKRIETPVWCTVIMWLKRSTNRSLESRASEEMNFVTG